MVFQNYALYPHLTVYENIAFPLRLAGAPDSEVDEKVRKASQTLELDEHLERKPGNLSGGQRQRVAMGRAIVRDADAFLFDEPLSNLDAKLRGQMRTEISRLQKRLGITTVYVTHDQTEAMTLGDRVAVLKRGVLQQLATPRELYENPGNLFVAGFIGSPPMNFLPATVEGTSVKLPFGTVEIPADKAEKARGKGLLIAGIRPEHFEDASVLDASRRDKGSTFRATVDVVEWLGNEAYAYIPFEAPPEVREQLDQLERDLDGEAHAHPAGRSPSTAPAGSPRATRPRSGSTPPRSTCSTRAPARTSRSTPATPASVPGRQRDGGRRGRRARAGPGRQQRADRLSSTLPAGGETTTWPGAQPRATVAVSGEQLPLLLARRALAGDGHAGHQRDALDPHHG